MSRCSAVILASLILAVLSLVANGADASAAPTLRILPDTIDFGAVTILEPRIDSFRITNAGTDSLRILGVEGPGIPKYTMLAQVPNTVWAGLPAVVRVEFRSDAAGSFSDRIVVHSDGGSDTVILVARAVPADTGLLVFPDTLRLGTVTIPASRLNSVTVTNLGSDSITVEEIAFVSKNGDYRILSPEVPFGLGTGRLVNVEFELRAHDTGCTSEKLIVVTESISDTVILEQCAIAPQTHPELEDRRTLVFPQTDPASCSQKAMETSHSLAEEIVLYGVYANDTVDNVFRCLLPPAYNGLTLPPFTASALPFEFCPPSPGEYAASFRCITDQGIFIVETTGTSVEGQQEGARQYYLDTVSGSVGEKIVLELFADPPLTPGDQIDSIGLTVRWDVRAMVLTDVRVLTSAGETPVDLRRSKLGTGSEGIVMKGMDGPLTGHVLLLLEFIGLSTGKPTNIVRLEGKTSSPTDTVFSNGLILLEGCTVGTSGFSRKIAIESLAIDPSGTHVVLRYTAPEHAVGSVSAIDAAGAEVTRFQLAPGTGAQQSFRLPLDDFHPGLYGLLIEVADDRVILPFISPR